MHEDRPPTHGLAWPSLLVGAWVHFLCHVSLRSDPIATKTLTENTISQTQFCESKFASKNRPALISIVLAIISCGILRNNHTHATITPAKNTELKIMKIILIILTLGELTMPNKFSAILGNT